MREGRPLRTLWMGPSGSAARPHWLVDASRIISPALLLSDE